MVEAQILNVGGGGREVRARILRCGWHCADRYGSMEGSLGGYTGEEVAELVGRDDTAVAEVFELCFNGADAAIDLRLVEFF